MIGPDPPSEPTTDRLPFRGAVTDRVDSSLSRIKNGEQRSDTELLLAARTSSEPFGVFYERHFVSVLAFFRRRTPGQRKHSISSRSRSDDSITRPLGRGGSSCPRRNGSVVAVTSGLSV